MGRIDALKDKVAIIGMGSTKFGEHWTKSVDDMIIEAVTEAYEDAGVGSEDIEAGWVGTVNTGLLGILLTTPMKFTSIPVCRIENGCATGIELLRHASMAIASGLYDIVLVVGAEKLKDTGFGGLPEYFFNPVYAQGFTPPGRWALAATRYFKEYGITPEDGKRALARIAVKNHHNGALSPKAHFQKEITIEDSLKSPIVAWPLGLMDCCPTTDGASAAVLCRADLAPKFKDDFLLIKGFGMVCGHGVGKEDIDFSYSYLPETKAAAEAAYKAAGITNPRKELSMAQVHDCFTIAELLEYEALGLCAPGTAPKEVMAGTFDLDGEIPVNTDGGLKAFGHPLGATGIRMCYEIYNQVRGKAGKRQVKIKDGGFGLAMPQGGHPGLLIPSVAILGSRD